MRLRSFPAQGMVHQDRKRKLLHRALRQLRVLYQAAGLIGDVFVVPRIIAGPGGGSRSRTRADSTRFPARPTALARRGSILGASASVTMTDFGGSKTSSLCSPLVRSTSAETPTRKWSGPSSGSSVGRDLVLQALLDAFCDSRAPLRRLRPRRRGVMGRGRFRQIAAGIDHRDLVGARARARRWRSSWQIAATFCGESAAAWRSFTSTLAFAGWRASE